MASLIYHLLSSSALISLGLYHLILTTKNHLKSPREYTAKPYHPFPSPSHHRLKHIHLYLLIASLTLAFLHQTLTSSYSDPLLKGNTHRFTSLQSAAVTFLFLILSITLLLSESTSVLPITHDIFFGLAAGAFFLQYKVSSAAASVQTSDLQAKCDSVSAQISALSSLLCLILACLPKLFVADVGLGSSICLQGLWVLQTGLSLYVDVFIPEGCHKLLDVVSGVEGSTRCDLEDSKMRAVAILDLMFVVHVMVVVVVVLVCYGVVGKSVGVRRFGSYEALPTLASGGGGGGGDANHIQMKAIAGTQA